ncbi:MAG: hypothetical protein HZA91_02660 [Verrucomicrobia bacterium]|nr:hypothetical protein [Verrucomicrobiota bacterium]
MRFPAAIAAALLLSACIASGQDLEAKLAAQAADTLIARSILASGGFERLAAVRDIVGSGDLFMRQVQPGQAKPAEQRGGFAIALKRPDKMRMEFTLGDTRRIQLFDGSRGWNVTVTRDGMRLAEITGDALRQLRGDTLENNDRLLTYKQRGLRARLVDPARFIWLADGAAIRACAEVEIAGYDLQPRRLFFDKQSDLIIKVAWGFDETYFGNFRAVEGVITAMKMIKRRGDEEIEFRFQDAKINSGVPDASFRPERKP